MRVTHPVLWAAAALLLAAGCTTYDSPFVEKTEDELDAMEHRARTAGSTFREGSYFASASTFSYLASERTVSEPLYRLDRIPALMFSGRMGDAHDEMVKLRADLEELYDPASEQKALSSWHGEVNKVYKGAPHEMSMFYVLMGLSFAERGEFSDAWRCVQNGILHDNDSKEEKYRSDFALLLYLGAVFADKAGEADGAAQCRRRLRETLDAMADRSKSIDAPLDNSNPDTLVLVWSGTPPTYGRDGEYGQTRTTLPGEGCPFEYVTVVTADGREIVMPPKTGDINYQATTRGGRLMDNVLQDKADLKDDMKLFAQASSTISGFLFGMALNQLGGSPHELLISGSLAAGGIAFLVFDGLFCWAYDSADPRADIRSWVTLPGSLDILPLNLGHGASDFRVRGYKAGDSLFEKKVTTYSEPGRITAAHVDMMGCQPYQQALGILNKLVEFGVKNPPATPRLDYPDPETPCDTSAAYQVLGIDPDCELKLNNLKIQQMFHRSLLTHGYTNHHTIKKVLEGKIKPRPDKIAYVVQEKYTVTNIMNQAYLDTRLAVVVRSPGKIDNGTFKPDAPAKFVYAWSRLPTMENNQTLSPGTKEQGAWAALGNLFKMPEFRAAMAVKAVKKNE